jgi:hypothetical protein
MISSYFLFDLTEFFGAVRSMCDKTYLSDYDILRGFLSEFKDLWFTYEVSVFSNKYFFYEQQSTASMSLMGLQNFHTDTIIHFTFCVTTVHRYAH